MSGLGGNALGWDGLSAGNTGLGFGGLEATFVDPTASLLLEVIGYIFLEDDSQIYLETA